MFGEKAKEAELDRFPLPEQKTLFYGMSLLFYVADYFSFALDPRENRIGNADGTLYNASELLDQMKQVNSFSWEYYRSQ